LFGRTWTFWFVGYVATAAARALVDIPELSAEEVARKAMTIAANMCVYTNTNFRTEVIDAKEEEKEKKEE
jgi:ATP-dependent HslUV protease subunit HslV